MHIHTRIVDDIAVVELFGQFVASDATFGERIRSLAQEGHPRVVLDLAGVNYMDSSGLGELIAGYIASKRAGGVLKLMRITRRVQILLTVTNLMTIFETFTDEAAAIASFSGSLASHAHRRVLDGPPPEVAPSAGPGAHQSLV